MLKSLSSTFIFVFDKQGKLEYSFPQKKFEDFGNVPDLVRSSKKLQEKTPVNLKNDSFNTSNQSLIAIVTDALSEFLFKNIDRVNKEKSYFFDPKKASP